MPLVEIDGRMVQVGRPKCIGKRVGFGLREELMPWYFFRIKDSEERNFPTKYLNGLIREDREAALRGDTLESQETIRKYREYLEETEQYDPMAEEPITPAEARAAEENDALLAEMEEKAEKRPIYATITDVVEQYVIPALGDYAEDYDVKAIACAIAEWREGGLDGFVVSEVGEKYFYEIAARYMGEGGGV